MESEREQLRDEFESLVSKQQARVEEWEEAVTAEEASLAKRRTVGGPAFLCLFPASLLAISCEIHVTGRRSSVAGWMARGKQWARVIEIDNACFGIAVADRRQGCSSSLK